MKNHRTRGRSPPGRQVSRQRILLVRTHVSRNIVHVRLSVPGHPDHRGINADSWSQGVFKDAPNNVPFIGSNEKPPCIIPGLSIGKMWYRVIHAPFLFMYGSSAMFRTNA
jgi:hypothetical protein